MAILPRYARDERKKSEMEKKPMPDEIETTNDEVVEKTDSSEFAKLPDDHPLVKTLAATRQEMKEIRKSYASASSELEEFRKASLTDQERLIESTRVETAQAIRKEFAGKLAEAELKSALNGKVLDGNAILSFDKTSFIDENGDVDSTAISAWVEAHTKTAETTLPDLGQGIRGKTSGKSQIRSREELQSMSRQEILEARKDGRLDSLMGKI